MRFTSGLGEWRGWKRGWEYVDGMGSELSNTSGVSWSEFSNCEMVWFTVIFELVSESMPDEVLTWGDSGGGKAKSGMIGMLFWRLAG